MGAKPFTEIEIERAKRLKRCGLTIGGIARELGRSRSGVERVLSEPFSQGRTCAGCPIPISNYAVTDYCRSCARARNNKIPELTAKRAEGKRRAMKDPLKYARACQVAKANIRKAMADPVKRAKFVELGRLKAATHFNTPEGRAWCNRPEVRERAGRSLSETRMAWCPLEYREQYKQLTRLKVCTAGEAREMILEQIERDRVRARSNLSPFERQERALARGAQLVANDQKPSLANPGIYRAGEAA
jgi:hypothetical protein